MGANLKKGINQPGQSGQPGQYSDKAVPPGLLFVQAAKDLCEAAASMQENPVISAFIGATYASLKDMALQAYPEASAQIQWQDGVGTTGVVAPGEAAAPGAVAPGEAIDEAKGPEIAAAEGKEGEEGEEGDEFSLTDDSDNDESDPFAIAGEDEDEEDADEDEEDADEDEENADEDEEDADEDEESSIMEGSDNEDEEDADEDEEDADEDEEDADEDEEDADEDEESSIMEGSDNEDSDEEAESTDDKLEDEDKAPPPKAKGKSKGKNKGKGSMPNFSMADKKQKNLNNLDKILEDTTISVSSLSDSVSGLVERLKKMTGRVD